jgi:hypothetical protein
MAKPLAASAAREIAGIMNFFIIDLLADAPAF